MSRTPLPIDEVMPSLLDALQDAPAVVLQAPTGAGKTTRVPPALLREGLVDEGRIVMLEPRRVAARAAASRMAYEWGEEVGQTIGYNVRFGRAYGPDTRILVVTEGIFLAMIQEDPFLEGIDAVVFDEFHERSLLADVSLAMVAKVQQELRPELKLIVMSATLAAAPVAAYLQDAPIVTSEGRSFPVELAYLDSPDNRSLVDTTASAVRREVEQVDGDILVFLPGVGEIRRVAGALEEWALRNDIALLSLYGDLPPNQQDEVLLPGPRRKVILSTNVAETSLTIEGVTGVIDTGTVKVMQYDPGCGLNRLVLEKSSQASTAQRAGRAGRTQAGRCLRLWMASEQQRLRPQDIPEIQRVDLSPIALQLLAWGETDLHAFPWFEAPESDALTRALQQLQQLGAIDEEHRVTTLGHQMVRFPLHPRLARLILAGMSFGCLKEVAWLAAMLSERDPFGRSGPATHPSEQPTDDAFERLLAMEAFASRHSREKWRTKQLKSGAMRQVQQAQRQLLRIAKHVLEDASASALSMPREERVGRALVAAFPERVTARRGDKSHRGVMASGQGVKVFDASRPLPSALCVSLLLDAGKRGERAEAIVRVLMPIEESWLPAEQCTTQVELFFDAKRARVMAMERTRFLGLLLREAVASIPDDADPTAWLVEAATEQLDTALSLQKPALATWLCRVRLLAEACPEQELPTFEREELIALLPMLCHGKRSFDELRNMPLLDMLKGTLSYQQLQWIDKHAPERFEVPSGSRIAIKYEEGKPQGLPVRIQEMFGCLDTPVLAEGRVPVLLHLLAPNMRPQQMTQDLRSFWQRTYPEVRKELRQRYPKHAWPEDPMTASPERRPQRKRR
jgi:ATP-dependent helicase HrpB